LLFDDAEHRFEHYAPKPVSCQQQPADQTAERPWKGI